jgi:hypothetical protein
LIVQYLVLVIGRDLGTNAPAQTLGSTLLHLLEAGQALLGRKLTARARDTIPTLFLHGLLVGIVGIGLAQLDDLDTIGIKLIKVVTGVGGFVGFDTLFLSVKKIH